MKPTPIKLTIQRNAFPQRPCELTQLPFVADVKASRGRTVRKFWQIPPVDCYATANNIGAQYAADLVQYLKDNPDPAGAGLLVKIVKDMRDAEGASNKSHGVAVGFFALIEAALAHKGTSFDHYAHAEAQARRVSAFLEAQE